MARRKAGLKRKTPSKVNSDAEVEDTVTIRESESVPQDEDRVGPEADSPNDRNEMNQMEEAEKEEEEEEKEVNMKRKAEPSAETSPSKKTKLIKDGCSILIGNLNNSKTFDEVKDSLANYLMAQSLLVQDIRLVRSKKHAYVDLASDMDLTKALTLNGEMILDKPVSITKAKVRPEKKVKVKAAPLDKKDKDARCLRVKNIPHNTTKADILKTFGEVIDVWFPGGAESPKKGIAVLEFKNEAIATEVRERTQGVQLQGRVLIVDSVGKKVSVPKVSKTNVNKNNPKVLSKTLIVLGLSPKTTTETLKRAFEGCQSARVPGDKRPGGCKGFGFVEYKSEETCKAVKDAMADSEIDGSKVTIDYAQARVRRRRLGMQPA